MKIKTLILSAFLLAACSKSAPIQDVGDLATTTNADESARMPDDTIMLDCATDRDCLDKKYNIKKAVSSDEQFSIEVKLGIHTAEMNLTRSDENYPLSNQFGGWDDPMQFWIRELRLEINQIPILIPFSVFADIPYPKHIYFGLENDEVIIIMQRDSVVTRLTLYPYECNGIKAVKSFTKEFVLKDKLTWYIPMAGGSYERTNYGFMLCN